MNRLTSFLLRTGLAAAFFYAATDAFLSPEAWVGFLPVFLRNSFPAEILLKIFSVYEIVLGVWILSNKAVTYSAWLAFATILGIIGLNVGAIEILFRDVPILFASLALATSGKKITR